jgi:hypothetical protein
MRRPLSSEGRVRRDEPHERLQDDMPLGLGQILPELPKP